MTILVNSVDQLNTEIHNLWQQFSPYVKQSTISGASFLCDHNELFFVWHAMTQMLPRSENKYGYTPPQPSQE